MPFLVPILAAVIPASIPGLIGVGATAGTVGLTGGGLIGVLGGVGSAVTLGAATGGTAAVIGAATVAGAAVGIAEATATPEMPGDVTGISTAAFAARQRAVARQRSAFGQSSTRVSRSSGPPVLATGGITLGASGSQLAIK